MFSRAWHRLHGFPGLTELMCLLRHLTASKKVLYIRIHSDQSRSRFQVTWENKTNKRLACASEAAVFYRVLGNHKAYNLFYKVTEHTFCSQSSRIFLICCKLFPSSSNAAGLFTDSVHLVSTGSPTFYMRKRQF